MRISDWSSDVCSSDLFHVTRNQASEIDSARLVELPHQAANLTRVQCNHIRFGMLHPRHLLHLGRMGLQIGNGADHHFMRDFTRILDKETNCLASADLDRKSVV